MIKSKLTTKSQTTIPRPVRVALGLEPGDEVVLFEPFYDSYPAAVAMASAARTRASAVFSPNVETSGRSGAVTSSVPLSSRLSFTG